MKSIRFLSMAMLVASQLGISAATLKLEQVGPPIPSLYQRGSIAYGNGAFVMLATKAILYSTNAGTSWLDAKVSVSNSLVFLKFVNGYFFAGADSVATLYISQDGIHWRSSQFSFTPTDVAFGNGKFVVTGGGLRAYSSDTLSWTEATAPALVSPATATGVMVAYGNGMFIAAELNNDGYHGIPPIDASVDGNIWTRLNVPAIKVDTNCAAITCDTVQTLRGLVFLNGKFIAYGRSVFSVSRIGSYLLESTDGLNWTVTSTSPPNFLGITPQNALTIVNGQISSTGIAFNGSLYVTSSLQRGFSPDNLVPIAAPPLRQGISAAQNGSTIVQVGPSILYSTNNWDTFVEPLIPDQTGALKSIRFVDDRYVAVGAGGTVLRSLDAVNWSRRLSNTTSDLYDVTYGNGFWVAVGAAGKIIVSSDNASLFAIRNSGTELPLFGVTFGAGTFVAVGANGLVLTSTDTLTWNPAVTDDGKHLLAVTYGDHRFVATGTNGVVDVSMNGLAWTSTNIAGANYLRRVAYGNGAFLTIENADRQAYFSTDGLAWTKVPLTPYSNGLPPNPFINGVDFTGNRFLLSGGESLLVQASPGLTVTAALSNGVFNLIIQTITNGLHTIFSTPDIATANWQNRGSINVNGQAIWTNSVQSATMEFYRVRQE